VWRVHDKRDRAGVDDLEGATGKRLMVRGVDRPRVEFVRAPTYRRGLFDGASPENS